MDNGQQLFDSISAGDRVTIEIPAGLRLDGSHDFATVGGRAVMLGPAGWVLNCGGRYGTPRIADADNIQAVRKPNSRK